FNAYPSGKVNSIDTTFSGLFSEASFWTSTSNDSTTAWRRRLFSSSVGVTKGYADKTMGFSCRCIEN
ncbi:MAG: fibrobacter succinogenes major paralogous domain-containing protein, partial [Saprospiraceae bacterium]|nr:fibrobacter succinogenes major paralogous domain-containing protein [Saprospiraceae bacterium]